MISFNEELMRRFGIVIAFGPDGEGGNGGDGGGGGYGENGGYGGNGSEGSDNSSYNGDSFGTYEASALPDFTNYNFEMPDWASLLGVQEAKYVISDQPTLIGSNDLSGRAAGALFGSDFNHAVEDGSRVIGDTNYGAFAVGDPAYLNTYTGTTVLGDNYIVSQGPIEVFDGSSLRNFGSTSPNFLTQVVLGPDHVVTVSLISTV